MVEIKNNETGTGVEIEWDNIDNFISDFARNNENMAEDVELESPVTTTKPLQKNSAKKPQHILSSTKKITPVSYSSVSEVSKKLVAENQDKFSDKYTGLHADIKNLLIELQEIKKARIDLQTKLESLR